jgi:hypothetical protein
LFLLVQTIFFSVLQAEREKGLCIINIFRKMRKYVVLPFSIADELKRMQWYRPIAHTYVFEAEDMR